MLQLRGITKDYVTASETVHALKGVDLAFRTKEFVSVLGPSGCGKTTLLNIIGGLDKYTSGDLIINGKSTKSFKDRHWDVYRNHRVGFIFQSYNLIPHQTILGNVELALTIAGIDKEERIRRAKEALDKVGLAGQYYKRPNQLSGGQCQRVAIARALVNDPEILLADEPTGALDTVTSVQIMELIREIAEERLVIMVTHNPELADKYSTRIVRFLDGLVVEDTNPMTEEEMAEEAKADEAIIAEAARLERENKKASRKAREKAKMSWFTAFRLSARNLLSKKGRTTMVGIAGSIGIIGIAMVLAFSAGIRGYIYSMQDDMLSGNPVEITETAFDLEALTSMMTPSDKAELIKHEDGKVFINSIVEYIAKMQQDMSSSIIKNDLTRAYVNYVLSMPKEYYAAMVLDYGIDLSNNVYTEIKTEKGGTESRMLSVTALTNIYTAILEKTDFKQYSSYVSTVVPSFTQAPNSKDYIAEQYDVIGKIATEKNEIMLVLDSNDRLSDVLLARLGYYAQDEFINIVHGACDDKRYDESLYRDHFTNEELLGKTLVWYPNDTVFVENDVSTQMLGSPYAYDSYQWEKDEAFSDDGAVELKVVGILSAKEGVSYGCLKTGVYYTEALTEHVLEQNKNSEIVKYLDKNDNFGIAGMQGGGVSYNFNFTWDEDGDGVIEEKNEDGVDETAVKGVGVLGSSGNIADMITNFMGGGTSAASGARSGSSDNSGGNQGAFPGGNQGGTGGFPSGGMGGAGGMGGMGGSTGFNISGLKTLTKRNLGGVDLASTIAIYPVSFDDKDLVTGWLDDWNSGNAEGGALTYFDVTENKEITLTDADRADVTYTDTLELIINIINTMISAITTALIAFTSVSLVVSTVMIGIITFVSVVERIKEIGVIRSLGGRKRDVGNLFRCETFIIGLLSGLIGVGFTYIASAIVSAVVYNLIGIRGIAQLPIGQAAILVGLSVLLTSISGLIPASSAAKKDPVIALRTE